MENEYATQAAAMAAGDEDFSLTNAEEHVLELRKHLTLGLVQGDSQHERAVLEWLREQHVLEVGYSTTSLDNVLSSHPTLSHTLKWFALDVMAALLFLLPKDAKMEQPGAAATVTKESQADGPVVTEAPDNVADQLPEAVAAKLRTIVSEKERRCCLHVLLRLLKEYPSALTLMEAIYPLLIPSSGAATVKASVGGTSSTAAQSLQKEGQQPSKNHVADTLLHSETLRRHRALVGTMLSTLLMRPTGLQALLTMLLLSGSTEAEEDFIPAAKRVALLVAAIPRQVVDTEAAITEGTASVAVKAVTPEEYFTHVGPQVVELLRRPDPANSEDNTEDKPDAPAVPKWAAKKSVTEVPKETVGLRLRCSLLLLLNELLRGINAPGQGLGSVQLGRLVLVNQKILGPCFGVLRLRRPTINDTELLIAVNAVQHLCEAAVNVATNAAFLIVWESIAAPLAALYSFCEEQTAQRKVMDPTSSVAVLSKKIAGLFEAVVTAASTTGVLGTTKVLVASMVRATTNSATAVVTKDHHLQHDVISGTINVVATTDAAATNVSSSATNCVVVRALEQLMNRVETLKVKSNTTPNGAASQDELAVNNFASAVFREALSHATLLEAQAKQLQRSAPAVESAKVEGLHAQSRHRACTALVVELITAFDMQTLLVGVASEGQALVRIVQGTAVIATFSWRALEIACRLVKAVGEQAFTASLRMLLLEGDDKSVTELTDTIRQLQVVFGGGRELIDTLVAEKEPLRQATGGDEDEDATFGEAEATLLKQAMEEAKKHVELLNDLLISIVSAESEISRMFPDQGGSASQTFFPQPGSKASGGHVSNQPGTVQEDLEPLQYHIEEAVRSLTVGVHAQVAVSIREVSDFIERLTNVSSKQPPRRSGLNLRHIEKMAPQDQALVRNVFASSVVCGALELLYRSDDPFVYTSCIRILGWTLLHRLDSERCQHLGQLIIKILSQRGAPPLSAKKEFPFRVIPGRWSTMQLRILEVLLCVADFDAEGATLRWLEQLGLWNTMTMVGSVANVKVAAGSTPGGSMDSVALRAASIHALGPLYLRLHRVWPVKKLMDLVKDVFRLDAAMARSACAAMLSFIAISLRNGELPLDAMSSDDVVQLRSLGQSMRTFKSAPLQRANTTTLQTVGPSDEDVVDDDRIVRAHGERIVEAFDAIKEAAASQQSVSRAEEVGPFAALNEMGSRVPAALRGAVHRDAFGGDESWSFLKLPKSKQEED